MKQNQEKRTLIVPESLINRAEMLRFKILQSQGVGLGAAYFTGGESLYGSGLKGGY